VRQLRRKKQRFWLTLSIAGLSAMVTPFAGLALAQTVHPAEEIVERASVNMRTDPEASRRAAEAALQSLTEQPDPDLEVRARLVLCDYLSERDSAEAEREAERASQLLMNVRRPGLRAGVLICRGTIQETAGHNAQALQLYEEAVAVAEAADDNEMHASALFSRGYLLGLQGQYAAGLADLKRSLSIYDDMELRHHSMTALNGIAILYNRMGDYVSAREMYKRALKEQRASGLLREEAVTLHNLGRAHENLQEWDDAEAAFQESANISRSLQYPRGEAYALRGLAAIANARNQASKALELLARAEVLYGNTPDARLRAQVQLARGVALWQQKKLTASVAALEDALKVFTEADSLHELRETYMVLAQVYADLGQFPVAYETMAKAKITAERLLHNQIDQRFASLKVEFDTAATEQANAILLRENQANQNALEHAERARAWQRAVIVLTVLLAGLLASLVVHQWRTSRRMRSLALTDELTGVPNRRAMFQRLYPLLQSRAPCALLIVDIDHFKQINDRYGHPEGDQALKLVAECIRKEVREPAFLGRLGGEEFVIALPAADRAAAHALAECIRTNVAAVDSSRWQLDPPITVSIGGTLYVAGDTVSTMLQRADGALYDAKRAGRNCVKFRLPDERAGNPHVRVEAAARSA
jgi:diguanylate cyclase (GGDEF)-like protein